MSIIIIYNNVYNNNDVSNNNNNNVYNNNVNNNVYNNNNNTSYVKSADCNSTPYVISCLKYKPFLHSQSMFFSNIQTKDNLLK